MTPPIITIFGGTGFVGRAIVNACARQGWIIRIATRNASRADSLRVCGTPGQIVPFTVDYSDERSVSSALRGADYAVYSIGLLFERGRSVFQKAHVDYPATIARLCKDVGIKRLVHVSAIGCDKAGSNYAKTKLAGEQAILAAYPTATIMRPSLIFGAGDGFFNLFAEMLRFAPALPLFGGGKSLFQPVFVDDVAACVVAALNEPKTSAQIYDIAGAQTYSFAELLRMIMDVTGRHVPLIPVPFAVARVQAVFLSLLPKPLLTQDQITSLQTDAVADGVLPGMASLGIAPTALVTTLPTYLSRFRAHGEVPHA